jgi:hypothetical protein
VRLGVGLAIVNDICRLPAGTTAVPVPELPAIDYYLLEPAGRRRAASTESLRALIIEAFKPVDSDAPGPRRPGPMPARGH